MKLVFRGRSAIELQRLPKKEARFVLKKLVYYLNSDSPLTFAERLTDYQYGDYRFRIGYYRVTFDVEGDKIVVLKVGHRKDVYR